MDTIETLLTREIKNRQSRFVFPSETASSRWARRLLAISGERSIALNRFLAWDRFKEGILHSEMRDKRPISSVVRKLFVEDLARKNAKAAAAGSPLFRAIIPTVYASEGRIFSASIAAMLPSLGFWETRLRSSGQPPDDEDEDLLYLKKVYAEFLAGRGLFEPSWETPSFGEKERRYYLFFPELIEDFAEYEALLKAASNVNIINREEHEPPPVLYRFDSARAEIRDTVIEIRRLHEEEGIPYEEMAVSVPGLEDAEPYLLREFALRGIPVHRRAGKRLSDFGTGKLFSLINSCGTTNFSFPALKSLLLNERIPWRYPGMNKELIEFGVRNNCVSPYRDNGRPVDIWVEAFRSAPREERLYHYYKALKSGISGMTEARRFSDIKRRYGVFRGDFQKKNAEHPGRFLGFLSQEACSDEGDAVLARCIVELSSLIQIEEEYPDLVPDVPFTFFLGELSGRQYVPQRQENGVNIFPYRLAAAAPFACHFVLNASQNSATVLYRPLAFLRRDKRKTFGISAEALDVDASAAFFSLYRGGDTQKSRVRQSASDLTFSGWAIPHSFFTGRITPAPAPARDPFQEEQAWWAGRSGKFPESIFPVQRKGFERWSAALLGQRESPYRFLTAPFPAGESFAERLRERVREVQERTPGLLKASATDLTDFFFCPASWLYRKVWALSPFTPEAKLLDDASMGLLYHAILKNLFEKIRAEDRFFKPERLDAYRRWAEECTAWAVRQYPAFQGPLAVPLLVSQSEAISRKIRFLLETEADYFAGYAVGELESPLEHTRGNVLLNGRLDRISISPDNIPVIVDYKTGKPPSKKDSTAVDSVIRNFQMPMYVKLYEAASGQRAEGAFFVSINQRDITAVVGSPRGKRGQSREAYQPTLDALDGYIEKFQASLESLDFAPEETSVSACFSCEYKTVCRTAYASEDVFGEASRAR
ncbi:MAG: PD-(D/E)XK nuclease family protein [Treponema sp.]|nr:PD-(D/E)XK nuclease family protein [Treponema sp.]